LFEIFEKVIVVCSGKEINLTSSVGEQSVELLITEAGSTAHTQLGACFKLLRSTMLNVTAYNLMN
jgi:hypothetical protein